MGAELVTLSVIGAMSAGEAMSDVSAAKSQKKALDQEAQQAHLQYLQRSASNMDTAQRLLDTQVAQASVRGVGVDSPSFSAIQTDTFNTFAKQQQNMDAEFDIFNQNISTQKKNVNNTLYSKLFGDAAQAAMMGYQVGKAPGPKGSSYLDNLFGQKKSTSGSSPIDFSKVTKDLLPKGLWG